MKAELFYDRRADGERGGERGLGRGNDNERGIRGLEKMKGSDKIEEISIEKHGVVENVKGKEGGDRGDPLDFHDFEILVSEMAVKGESLDFKKEEREERGEGEVRECENSEEEGEVLDWVVDDIDSEYDVEEWSGDTEGSDKEEDEEEEWEVEDIEGEIEAGVPQGGSTLEVTSEMRRRQLSKYEIRCPPGGEESVVVYTTSLGGIRKTFADCNCVRQILQSFRLQFDERDISIHSKFRMELMSLMGGPSKLPQLFIRGYYIGGVDEIVRMSEESELDVLFEGIPRLVGGQRTCGACGGLKFIPCPECSGSHKIMYDDGTREDCPDCNEYGLAQCPLCITFFGG